MGSDLGQSDDYTTGYQQIFILQNLFFMSL